MPILIPKRPHPMNGEHKALEILVKLPDDCIVCHEPNIRGRQPDFVVFSPRLGILVVEVKALRPETLIEGDQNTLKIQPKGKPVTALKHPLKQAKGYMYELREALLRHPLHEEIINGPDHHLQGHLLFPLAACVLFTNIRQHDISDHPIQQSGALFPVENTIFADEVQSLAAPEITGEALEEKLKRLFMPKWHFTLSARQQMVVQSILSHVPLDKLVTKAPATEEKVSLPEPHPTTEPCGGQPVEILAADSSIGLAVDSMLQQLFSLNASKRAKEMNIGILKNEMDNIGQVLPDNIGNNTHQCAAHISKIAQEISHGIVGEQIIQQTNELYYATKALKLKNDEMAMKKDIDSIEQQQRHLKQKISRLAAILELETA